MLFSFFSGKKRLSVPLHKVGFFRRGSGLMWRTRGTKNLLFEFSKPCKAAITALFVFFPFAAVWLDTNKRVVDVKLINPFTFSIKPRVPAQYLVELPLNGVNAKIIAFLVGKTKRFK